MDFSFIHQLTNYLHAHPYVGFFIVFLISFGESLAIIGSIIPGSVVMTAIGALIGAGVMPFTPTLLCAMVGAFLGDYVSYWVGARYNDQIRRIWPLRNNPKWLKLGEDFFEKHGGKSVVFGRFFGPVRSAVPLIAGMMQLTKLRFIIAAVPSAFFWALIYIFPGIIVGLLSLELPKDTATKFILLVLAAVAFGWVIFMAIHVCLVRALQAIDYGMRKSWSSLSSSRRLCVVTNFLGGPHQINPYMQLTRLLAASICLVAFIWLFVSVCFQGFLTFFNEPLFFLLRSLRNVWTEYVMVAITALGDKKALLPAAFLIGLGLIWRKRVRTGLIWLGVVVMAAGSVYIMKYIYFSPRPEGLLNGPTSSSFPSGHTTLSVAIYGFLAFLVAASMKSPKRQWVYISAGVLAGAVGLSRLYLGAHWLTDILAAISLGLICVLLGAVVYLRRPDKPLSPVLFGGTAMGLILLVCGVYGATQFHKEANDYALAWPKVVLNENQWWENGSVIEEIPLFATSRLGKIREVLNVQWLGDLEDITTVLAEQGWVNHPIDLNIEDTLQRLSVRTRSAHLPILPTLYHNRLPVGLYTRKDEQGRQVTFMLWRSFVTMEGSAKQFWLGSVFYYIRNKTLDEMTSDEIRQLYDIASDALINSLKERYTIKIIQVSEDAQPLIMQSVHWDGDLVLIK